MKHILSVFCLCITITSFSQKEIATENINGLLFQNLFDASTNKSISCYRIPSIITAVNGDVIVTIDERIPSCGDLKWSNDINIVMRRSKDNGKSWSNIETIVDLPLGQSASDPSMILDKITGDIFLFYNYMDIDNEKDVYYLRVMKSIDNGKTWLGAEDITSQITKPEWKNDFKFITSGRGMQTSDGKLVHTLVNLKNNLHVFVSDNHGKSWYLIDTPIKPANESKIIALNDGSWMINSRVNKDKFRYVHTSINQGKSWTSKPAEELIDARCNASIIRYSSTKNGATKNRLLFSNANSTEGRKNLTIKISYDEGNTWTKGKTIYIGSAAYSSLTVLKNGNIGVFFEKDNYKKNVFVEVSLDWLTDGKDAL